MGAGTKNDAGKDDWSILPWDAARKAMDSNEGESSSGDDGLWRTYARAVRPCNESPRRLWPCLAEALLVRAGRADARGTVTRTQALMAGLGHVVRVLDYGARKYSRDGWQSVEPERYVEALRRHLLAATGVPGWAAETDAESGESHWAHAACNALFLVWFSMREG